MKTLLSFIKCLFLLLPTACDVHEWPEFPEYAKLHLRLNYQTDMSEWKLQYDAGSVIDQGLGKTYNNHLKHGKIRYIIRTYPVLENQRTMQGYRQEFVFTKDIAEGYDHEVTLHLLPGNYHMIVWSDLVEADGDAYPYNADHFAEIMLQGNHQGMTNYRDAFYGKSILSLYPSNKAEHVDTMNMTMKRPLAKFEIVSNDLSAFLETKTKDMNQCKVKIQYVGFMPNAYSLFANAPIDSSTGVLFESTLNKLSEMELSLGWDYVFVSEKESTITIKIGIYGSDEKQISMTEVIEVPIKQSHHTIVTGNFLMQDASGGININPDFDGNYNLVFP